MKRRGVVRTTTTAAIIAASILTPAIAAEPDRGSADNRMRGCRELLRITDNAAEEPNRDPSNAYRVGICFGTINALIAVGIPLGICEPPHATNEQAIRVVVQYIDARPARLYEDFLLLAIEALRNAWPCQK
jgi:hypothetical protein